ncbi:heavy-metal-associated domain-containing protein [Clostridium tertium]|uniref:heavy-metal-associated domain-containing protein n=1 Tax=Clostridium tertium TaxID=1559 RepID=UPI00241CD201|nr:heavy-metal-associated domain-containing protein [Clostridium tertium]
MKSLLKVANLNTNDDVISIREAVAYNEGVIACEVSLSKKEVSVVYDDKSITEDKIIISIEEVGYSII